MPRSHEEIEQIAKQRGWCLNSDSSLLENVLKALNMKQEKFGEYYCPCRIQRIPENICPCKWASDEIAKVGHCHCRIFYKCV
jgi:ferredoxin-thioredoxin reductase catalytic chain